MRRRNGDPRADRPLTHGRLLVTGVCAHSPVQLSRNFTAPLSRYSIGQSVSCVPRRYISPRRARWMGLLVSHSARTHRAPSSRECSHGQRPWAGTEKISRMAQWPDWNPPEQMIERQRTPSVDPAQAQDKPPPSYPNGFSASSRCAASLAMLTSTTRSCGTVFDHLEGVRPEILLLHDRGDVRHAVLGDPLPVRSNRFEKFLVARQY